MLLEKYYRSFRSSSAAFVFSFDRLFGECAFIFWLALSREWGNESPIYQCKGWFPRSLLRASQLFLIYFPTYLSFIILCRDSLCLTVWCHIWQRISIKKQVKAAPGNTQRMFVDFGETFAAWSKLSKSKKKNTYIALLTWIFFFHHFSLFIFFGSHLLGKKNTCLRLVLEHPRKVEFRQQRSLERSAKGRAAKVKKAGTKKGAKRSCAILLMEEILYELIGLSHYL